MNAGPVEVAAAIEGRIKESKALRDTLPMLGDAHVSAELRYDVASGLAQDALKEAGTPMAMMSTAVKKECTIERKAFLMAEKKWKIALIVMSAIHNEMNACQSINKHLSTMEEL